MKIEDLKNEYVFKTLHKRKNRVASVDVNFLKHAMVLQVYGQVGKTQ